MRPAELRCADKQAGGGGPGPAVAPLWLQLGQLQKSQVLEEGVPAPTARL